MNSNLREFLFLKIYNCRCKVTKVLLYRQTHETTVVLKLFLIDQSERVLTKQKNPKTSVVFVCKLVCIYLHADVELFDHHEQMPWL